MGLPDEGDTDSTVGSRKWPDHARVAVEIGKEIIT